MNKQSNKRKRVSFKIDETNKLNTDYKNNEYDNNYDKEYNYCKKIKISDNKYYKYVCDVSIDNLVDKFSKNLSYNDCK
jgi:hypothetical protein